MIKATPIKNKTDDKVNLCKSLLLVFSLKYLLKIAKLHIKLPIIGINKIHLIFNILILI